MRLHRDAHQVFQQPGNMRARQAVIAVAPLRETHHQSVAEQPGKMAAGGGGGTPRRPY